uniref:Uncharacterized protein n=1 Tax=Anguilla anguilla TaxID=7936 RepID=A0A0E9TG94_ANGAN
MNGTLLQYIIGQKEIKLFCSFKIQQ